MKKKLRKILFITDPFSQFDTYAETTLFLMESAQKKEIPLFQCCPEELFLTQKNLCAKTRSIFVDKNSSGKFSWKFGREIEIDLSKFSHIFLRKDPPFDQAYFDHLSLLENLEKNKKSPLFINSPSGIKSSPEKILPLSFAKFSPTTLVARDIKALLQFCHRYKNIVLKPLHLSGGRGIVHLEKPDLAESFLSEMTQNGTQTILAQCFIPEVKNGDKRILLWRGKVLGAFLRLAKTGEFRSNLHCGGSFHATTVTAHDHKIINRIQPTLKKHGLSFVGLDIIGKYLTEINVTSPMGIREINTLTGKSVADEVMKKI